LQYTSNIRTEFRSLSQMKERDWSGGYRHFDT